VLDDLEVLSIRSKERQMRVGRRTIFSAVVVLATGLVLAACGGGGGRGDKTSALLLPEHTTARYETQDRPNFEREVRALCSNCSVVYENANRTRASNSHRPTRS
jgi:D-xylose transport system substrate-binding protein